MSQLPKYLRRPEAGRYIFERYGFCSPRSLQTLASLGNGPRYHRAGVGGGLTLYEVAELDRWAMAQIGPAIQSPRDPGEVAGAVSTAA